MEDCSSCRFYEKNDDPDYPDIGRCRRYPPRWAHHTESVRGFFDFDGDATDFFEFPVLRFYEWCGEWRAKE